MGKGTCHDRAAGYPLQLLLAATLVVSHLFCPKILCAQQNPKVEVREQTLADRTAAPDAERWLAIWAGAPGALDRVESNPTWLHHWQSLTRVSWGSVPARPLPDRHPLGQVAPQWLLLGGGPLAVPRPVAAGDWSAGLCPASAPRGSKQLIHWTTVLADDVGRVALLADLSCVHNDQLLRRARVRVEATAQGAVKRILGVVVDGPWTLAALPDGPLCTWPLSPRWDRGRKAPTWLTSIPKQGWLAGVRVGPGGVAGLRCQSAEQLPTWHNSPASDDDWPALLTHGEDGDPTAVLWQERTAAGGRWPTGERPGHWQMAADTGAVDDFGFVRAVRGEADAEQTEWLVWHLQAGKPAQPTELPLPAQPTAGQWQCEPDARAPQLVCDWHGTQRSALDGASYRLQWRGGRWQPVRD